MWYMFDGGKRNEDVLGFFQIVKCIFVWQGYCINVVWRCYKYCTWRAASLHSLTPFVISSEGLSPCGPHPAPYAVPAPDYSSLLPDYEDAVKQTPPPSYRAATLMATADPERALPVSTYFVWSVYMIYGSLIYTYGALNFSAIRL